MFECNVFSCSPSRFLPLECDAATLAEISTSSDYCGFLQDDSGPFHQCLTVTTQEILLSLFQNCVQDVCAAYDEEELAIKKVVCANLAVFAEICNNQATPADLEWRTIAGCG